MVCAEAVAPAERDALLERLATGGRHVESIGVAQMMNFAGNVLELRSRGRLERAGRCRSEPSRSLAPEARERLGRCVSIAS